jgi:hypothetical protein
VSVRRGLVLAGALALAGLLVAEPVFAADQVQPFTVNGGTMVRGGAPIPEFHLNFQLNNPGRMEIEPPGSDGDLDVALTTPDTGVFHFLFSPRPQIGYGFDQLTGVNRGFAGLTWSLFNTNSLFGSVGLAGSLDTDTSLPNDPLRRSLAPPLMLHGALELGYRLGDQHNLSLRFDEGRSPELRLNGETSDDFQLRYGLKF